MVADLTRDGKVVSARIDSLTELGAKQSRPMKRGDVVIAVSGAPGLPAILAHDACIHDGFVGLRELNNTRLDAEFLYAYLTFIRATSNSKAVGAIFKNLTTDQIKSIEIPDLPLAEQCRIAAVLDKAEALRAKRRAALAQLDSLTQSLFLDLFGDPVSNPKGLPNEPLSNLLSVKHGFAFKSEYFTDAGEFILLTPGNFYEGGGYRDRGDKQKYYIGPMPTGYTLRKDDLLVAMTEQAPGLLGSPILIPESDKFLHNQRLGLVEVKPCADRLFLFHLFNTPAIRNLIQASSTGTKVKHTSPTKISSITIPVPPISLQREFARRVTAVEKLKTAQRAALAELDALFASLQHRAFRGEL
jgi:type I restriction enzyme S subunit